MSNMNSKKTPSLSLTVQYASAAQNLPTRAQLRRWVKAALRRDATMTLRIVDDAEGRELNKTYRGKDYATNVLTFVYDEEQTPDITTSHSTRLSAEKLLAGHPKDDSQVAGYPDFPLCEHPLRGLPAYPTSGEEVLYGDVVICAPVVEREAREQGKDLAAHYAHLAIHAALHLQGYDHENDSDATEMEALEVDVMLKLRYANPYQTTRITNG